MNYYYVKRKQTKLLFKFIAVNKILEGIINNKKTFQKKNKKKKYSITI